MSRRTQTLTAILDQEIDNPEAERMLKHFAKRKRTARSLCQKSMKSGLNFDGEIVRYDEDTQKKGNTHEKHHH